jgi:presenilin-like A22 family membrane protease
MRVNSAEFIFVVMREGGKRVIKKAVVVLCVLLSSYVYLLYCVCIAVFYFRCRTAG